MSPQEPKYGRPLWSWRRGPAMMGLSLALGLAAAGTHSDAARALDAGAIARRHHSGVSASAMATAISRHATRTHHLHNGRPRHAGWCTQLPQLPANVNAMNRRAAVAPVSRRHRATISFPRRKRDELYREFQKWR